VIVAAALAVALVFDDLTVSLRPDGECFVMSIQNDVAAAVNVGEYSVPGEFPVGLLVSRGHGELPEHITVVPPQGWWADPYDFEIADRSTETVLLCQEVGA
jgi:hypothetical protein